MPINAFGLLILFSFTILIGYVGSLIFSKTKIPDVLWLLIFGLLIGPVLNLVDRTLFVSVSPFLVALALIIILFDAGLNMSIHQMIRGFSRSMVLAIIGVVLETGIIAFISMRILGFDLLTGLLLGSILAGTSSAVVISIVDKLKISENTKTILNLESILTDPIVIIVTIALINIITSTQQVQPMSALASAFSIGAVVGFIIGIIWLFALDRLKGKPFDYMLTLSVIFIMYVIVESLGGSGSISSLAFGLILGNSKTIAEVLKRNDNFGISHLLFDFQKEVSFFIRSFFFVYMGMIVMINQAFILYGIAISAVVILIRIITVNISMFRHSLSSIERKTMIIMGPKGLATAVLAQIPLSLGIKGGDIISNIAFIVILVTVLYTTIGIRLTEKIEKPSDEKLSEKITKPCLEPMPVKKTKKIKKNTKRK